MSNHDRKGPETPQRDLTLEQAWHQASNEQPPSRLDAAILTAAREAVGNRVARPKVVRVGSWSWLTQWQPVAAAAAVTGLAFVLVQMLPRDRAEAPSMQVEAPAVDAQQPVPSPPPVRNEADGASAAAKPVTGGVTERDRRVVPAPAAVPPAAVDRPSTNPVASNQAVAERASAAAAAEVEQRDATASDTPAATASAGMATAAIAAKQAAEVSVTAADWAARVAALYDSGETAQAADALRAFRAAHPDADTFLPESLRDWAGTIH